MRRLVRVAVLSLVALAARADDAPKPLLPAEAVWVMRYDAKLDGEVTGRPADAVRWAFAVRNDRVSGGLAGAKSGDPADHRVAGEVVAGSPPIILLRQDGPKGLVCYYTGKRVEGGRVVGTWFDNRGKAGDFEMVVEQK
jgi:hypothetical protein